ncbi:AMP-binding protein [Dactylosporangium matsuzakiense]|uniref:Phenylacetate--CoA ligase n=1 Tax=Dactylosporangium matsuzakiense TaxID=53360 RepID=A0A9W6KTW9_9ACTN|nr:AMP-binding protein [Dactylosporangium matsuzakiense]UWZ42742.1 phenylacetate--CoA ligase family protein [Dactylosporangium matsuzakiense]GLL05394.1 phenylacetate--CoA ligase [Dactylosporangium matsuzakiense]
MQLPQIGDWSSFAELSRLQQARLPAVLAAAERSPFYRKRGVVDLADQPLTTKQDLREGYPFGLLACDRADLATYHESSGSSGEPTASYYTESDWLDLAERFARKWTGITPEDTMLVRTPYALMITGHLAHRAARLRGATVVPADNRSLATPYSRVVRLLHDLGVTLTWSLPTDALLWAAAAQVGGYRDFPSLRALFVGGEPVSPPKKARIARLWGAPVVEEYGATETGTLAGECEHGTMHLWADRAVFEVQDPATGELRPSGRGTLVVTPLYREAMPLLRYAIEDEVEVAYRDCPCGWQLPAVRVLGRAGGDGPTQLGLEELVFSLPDDFGVWFWGALVDGDALRVEIEVADRWRAAATTTLTAALRTALPGFASVVVPAPPGELVPHRLLTAPAEVMKPRGLFRAGEDWDRALRYY